MHPLINKESGELIPVSHDQLGDSLASGQYQMPGDQPVALKDPNGELVEVDPQYVYTAVSQGGYSFPTEHEYSTAVNEVKYGDGFANKAKAVVHGAIEGIPFVGGSILSNIAPKEEVEGIKSAHPILNALGQVGTVAASAILAPEAEGVAAAKNALSAAKASGNVEAIALAAKNLVQAQSAFTGLDALNPVSAISKTGSKVAELIPEGLTATSKALSKVGQAAAKGAVEGSLFTAGQLANEYTLGDPNFNGENLVHDIGIGAVLGGVFGGALEGALVAGKGVASKLFGKAEEAALREGINEANQGAIAKLESGLASTIDESTPERAAIADALKNPNVIVDPPIIPAQIEQYASPKDKEIFQALRESTQGGDIVAREQLQKKNIVKSIDGIVSSISDAPVTNTLDDAGNRVIELAKGKYDAENASLKPFWKMMNEEGKLSISDPTALIEHIENAVPGAGKFIELDATKGVLKLLPYESTLGWERPVHRALKDVVEAMNKESLAIGDITNLRKNLFDVSEKLGRAGERGAKYRVDQLRTNLLGFVEDYSQNPEIREGLKRYAKNERFRDTMEYVLGGSLDDKEELKKKIIPEKVFKNIFSDSPTVAEMKKMFGDENFNAVLKDYMHHQFKSFKDPASGVFSSNKMKSFLSDHDGRGIVLTEAFGGNQGKVKDLRDYNALLRNISDAPSSNPPHTSKQSSYEKSYSSMTAGLRFLMNPKFEAMKQGFDYVKNKMLQDVEEMASKRTLINLERGMDPLAARADAEGRLLKFRVFHRIQEAKEYTDKKIESGVKNIFAGADVAKRGSGKAAELVVSAGSTKKIAVKDDYEKKSKKIRIMAQNPEQTMTGLADATEALHQFAPQTATSFHTTIAKGIQFLDSKIPMSPGHYPMSADFTPGRSEMQAFLNYYDMVENPLKVMDKIKAGILTPGDMEVMTQVHQETYGKIQKQMLLSFNPSKQVPYQTKMMLTLFMGQPMDGSMTSQSIMTNQIAIAGPSQQEQGGMGPIKPTQKGAENLTLASRSLTPMQKANARNQE